MAGFENGRLQTAARAVGVMQAAYEAALEYARSRKVFGEPIINYELTRVKLGTMAAIIQCSRQFSFEVARLMVTALARWRHRWPRPTCVALPNGHARGDADPRRHGLRRGVPVSRYFVDARVLSIFEGPTRRCA